MTLPSGISLEVSTWSGPRAVGAGQHGGNNGPAAVILLHGHRDGARAFDAFVEALLPLPGPLPGGFWPTIVAPDQRGHGRSDRGSPTSPYAIEDHVGDLDDLVEALGFERVDLVGHSMGANVAAYFAAARPQRVRRLVMVEGLSIPASRADHGQALAAWLTARRRDHARSDGPVPRPLAIELLRRSDPWLDDAGAARCLDALSEPVPGGVRFLADPRLRLPAVRPYRDDRVRELLGAVRAPTLAIQVRDARLGGERAVPERASWLPNGTLRWLDDGGHMILRHRPAQVADLVSEHLAPRAPSP